MSTEEQLKQFARKDYWDDRYSRGDEHEWSSLEFADLEQAFSDVLPPASLNPQLLHLGCGTSTLTRDLYDSGYHAQTNVDFSSEAIKTMTERFSREGVEWLVQDVRDMTDVRDQSIDVAIDKCTLDAMLHGSLFDPPDDVTENVKAYVDEVTRILRPNGIFVYLTWRTPLIMRNFLEREGVWTIESRNIQKLAGSFDYVLYIMRRTTPD